ncbi:MAG: translation initiation factor IF-2 subunit beta [Candidatus Micrarchaeia archaeon]
MPGIAAFSIIRKNSPNPGKAAKTLIQMTEYEKLLDKAYSQLPEKATQTERFEMPYAESHLQGTKTIIRNIDVIASKIRRDGQLLSKYFSKELAVPATYANGKLTLHGKFSDRAINEKLTNFVNAYVLCKECKKPDTKLIEGAHGVKSLLCEACGARSPIR